MFFVIYVIVNGTASIVINVYSIILYLGDRFGARAFLVDLLYFIHKIYNYLQEYLQESSGLNELRSLSTNPIELK